MSVIVKVPVRALRVLLSKSYGRIAVVAALAAAVGLAYWYRLEIGSAYTSTREATLTTVGLGVAPVALWLAAFLWTLATRPSWFKRANLWIGSLLFLALTLGALSFFRADQGPMASFTLDDEVSLGGRVGEAVVGPADSNAALRGLRVAAPFVAGAAIVAPRLALDVVTWMGKMLVFAYVLFTIAVRGLFSALRRLYGFKPKRDDATAGEEAGQAEPFGLGAKTGTEPSVAGTEFGPPSTTIPSVGSSAVSRETSSGAGPLISAAREPEAVSQSGSPGPTFADGAAIAEVASGPSSLSTTRGPGPPAQVYGLSSTDLSTGGETGPAQVSVTSTEDNGAGPPAALSEGVTGIRMLPESAEGGDVEEPASGATKYNKFWNEQQPSDGLAGVAESGKDNGAENQVEPAAAADSPSWGRPPMDLLDDAHQGGILEEQMVDTAETIKRTLAEYGVEVEIGEVRPGPAVTMYGLVPGWVRRYKQVKVTDEHGNPKLDESGKPIMSRVETRTRVKVDSILSREKDLSLALKTPSLRIETPVMGKALVGIEVPNPDSTLVTLRNVMQSEEYKKLRPTAALPIALGKGSGGETVVGDLVKMPHLLVAGATGSGKSVFINTILACLIMEKTPDELRLLLVDPKRVELTPFNGIPHLLTPVVVETDQVVGLLKGLIREMLDRYRKMEELGARNIDSYNSRVDEKMPYLVVAIDELADLMMSASFDVEQSLCRLAQLGRATGIHLIVATQRPSVDVVTGLIKANFPSRVAFGVTSQIDSRTILDSAGAERLLGKGDMLYLAVDASRPERVQGDYVSDEEIDKLVTFWHRTPRGPLPNVSLHTVGDGDSQDRQAHESEDYEAKDKLLQKAIEMAYQHKKISTSLLQRRLRIGYPRAARLMDQLEDEGIVGPGDGSKSRDVIISAT